MVSVAEVKHHVYLLNSQSSGAVWKSRWPSWAPVPNKPMFSVDVKQHFNNMLGVVRRFGPAVSRRTSVLIPIKFSSFLFKFMLGVVRRFGLAVNRRTSVLIPIKFSSFLFKFMLGVVRRFGPAVSRRTSVLIPIKFSSLFKFMLGVVRRFGLPGKQKDLGYNPILSSPPLSLNSCWVSWDGLAQR